MIFSSELALLNQIKINKSLDVDAIIALDEVGRGCVAGPVLTCASLWVKSSHVKGNKQTWITQVKDSKKLTPSKRLSCYNHVLNDFNFTSSSLPYKNSGLIPYVKLLKSSTVMKFENGATKEKNHMECIGFCLGEGSLDEVEQYNIWNAVQIAFSRALLGLKELFLQEILLSKVVLLMDGKLPISVPEEFKNIAQVTVVDGDDLFVSVGFSSIMAKVHRDLFMESQDNIYPQFGFSKHKGYGTPFHLEKIREHGPCELHRLSFLKKYIPLATD